MDAAQTDPAQIGTLSTLDDPKRRQLYDYVVAQAVPVTRDTAAEALGVERATVAYHLDKLVEVGLLATSFARPDGRSGPGAGRPSKHYERTAVEFSASVPPRDYQLAAELLARAVEADATGTVARALQQAAAELGLDLANGLGGEDLGAGDLGAGHEALFDQLVRQGFEPYMDGDVIRLRNCPFHQLARQHTELICGMNLAMLGSVSAACGDAFDARLEPDGDRCCVAFTRRG